MSNCHKYGKYALMRILILANDDGGLWLFRKELLEKLLERTDVFIALPEGDYIPNLLDLGCQYLPFEFKRRGMNPLNDLWQIHRYQRLLKSIHPDVVLTYTIKPNIYGGIACQRACVPYIANVTGLGTSIEDGGILSRLALALYRQGLKGAKRVFFQNAANRKFFLDKKVVLEKNTEVLPGSGVNLENHGRQPYPPDDNGIRFLFVGRIMRDKGIGELLEAFTILNKKHPNISLDIVGSYDELEWESKIQQAVNEGGIRYWGRQLDVRPFYRDCHCVVLPSYHEGLANVLLEAAATGRPVISTRVPGCKAAYDEGTTGLGCKARDSASLLAAMECFLHLSQKEKEDMGQKGRCKIASEFDRNIVITKYLKAIFL